MNKRFSDEDCTSSRWLKAFLVNSCSPDLKKEVEKKYDKLAKNQKGGVIYLYYLLSACFKMTRESNKAIQQYLDFWKEKGLAKVQGENVLQAELLILGCCKRLDATGALQEEYVINILEGLCICSCPEFKNMFEVMLQMAKLGSYDVLPTITLTSTPLDMIEAILTKAVDQYVVIADAGNWNVPKGRGGGGGGQHALASGTETKLKCWNCGKEGCNVKKCKEPKNEERIKQN